MCLILTVWQGLKDWRPLSWASCIFKTVSHWRRGNPDIIVAQYLMWNLAGPHLRNLTWLQANHPEWILYKCDRKTVQTWDHTDVQIDASQASVVAWQLGLLVTASP